MATINFTDTVGVDEAFRPTPASFLIPDWYKNIESYIGGKKVPSGDGKTNSTIKKCMPVFDALTSGYILYTYVDVFVSQKPNIDVETGIDLGGTIPYYEWPSYEPIGFHTNKQAQNYIKKNASLENFSYPKWANPWSIKTPKGYSCLFTQPFHRESVFTIFEGVVDTDSYTPPVNFPFVLNDWKFEGLIPAGTPMAQVIPFKRDSWKMELGNAETLKEQDNKTRLLKIYFFDAYKNKFRQPKEYK